MALSTTKITLKQIRDTLGETTLALAALCTSPKINEWSPYKPVSFKSTSPLTDTDFRTVKYGFNIPTSVTASALGVWIYQMPTGGTNSPYRLGDFIGYNNSSTRLKLSVFLELLPSRS